MKGLVCRLARGLNKVWRRRGSVFPKRFHDVVLRSLRAIRNALVYVLNNHRKHGVGLERRGQRARRDEFSSAKEFDGFADHRQEYAPGVEGAHVAQGGWQLAVGWKGHYPLIRLEESPAR
ncbi:MAG: hypothetical protein H6716_23075 [Polyangiaceae bacterium]|nr:hypothetical protein [Polyangiaceae bacterium]